MFPCGAIGKDPACQCNRHETRVQSLGQEDPVEKGMATHSRILSWRIPWRDYTVHSVTQSQTWLKWFITHTHTHTGLCVNSCLNPHPSLSLIHLFSRRQCKVTKTLWPRNFLCSHYLAAFSCLPFCFFNPVKIPQNTIFIMLANFSNSLALPSHLKNPPQN